jgi:hypothetical protein
MILNFENYNFINEIATTKDLDRINGIMTKSNGNEAKAVQLATTMANKIKDKQKAIQRYEAALELLGEEHSVTSIFAEKAISLGHKINLGAVTKTKNTHGALGSEDSKLKNMGRDRSGVWKGGTPILPLGSVNLTSGKNKYFNIYANWKDDNGTIELWKDDNDKYKLVITSGSGPIFKIGNTNQFKHDQTGAFLFHAILIDWCNIGDASLLIRKYNIKSGPGYVYK